jgi:hypothetical protein
MKLKEAFGESTKPPFELLTGKGTCFHEGNKVCIQKVTGKDEGEDIAETVAEVWPTSGNQDKIDGALLVHCYNNFQELVEALESIPDKSKAIKNLLVKVNNVKV